jgi:hypothetical protein
MVEITTTEGVTLEPEEAQKLEAFTSAIDAEKRNRYRYLRRRLEEECLTTAEHQELVALTDEVEIINVARMELLVEIGKRHHLSLAETVDCLHISPLLP